MISRLCGVFQDINIWVAENVGTVGTSILIALLSVSALLLLGNMVQKSAAAGKIKFTIWQFLLLVILILVIIWLCLTYNAA